MYYNIIKKFINCNVLVLSFVIINITSCTEPNAHNLEFENTAIIAESNREISSLEDEYRAVIDEFNQEYGDYVGVSISNFDEFDTDLYGSPEEYRESLKILGEEQKAMKEEMQELMTLGRLIPTVVDDGSTTITTFSTDSASKSFEVSKGNSIRTTLTAKVKVMTYYDPTYSRQAVAGVDIISITNPAGTFTLTNSYYVLDTHGFGFTVYATGDLNEGGVTTANLSGDTFFTLLATGELSVPSSADLQDQSNLVVTEIDEIPIIPPEFLTENRTLSSNTGSETVVIGTGVTYPYFKAYIVNNSSVDYGLTITNPSDRLEDGYYTVKAGKGLEIKNIIPANNLRIISITSRNGVVS